MGVLHDDAAKWMQDYLIKNAYLEQEVAVNELEKVFGNSVIYYNQKGNPSISKEVLKQFSILSEADFVWSRHECAWRKRTSDDLPGRQQD
ncbi:MAG: hypothetical protein IPO40_23630 [Fibrobacteres bacterium]|nr:hypothetical protein [Fibrobacterota bacterium]